MTSPLIYKGVELTTVPSAEQEARTAPCASSSVLSRVPATPRTAASCPVRIVLVPVQMDVGDEKPFKGAIATPLRSSQSRTSE